MADKVKIVQEILDYKKSHSNKPNSAWYAGIASNPRKRLFEDHNVDEKNNLWIHCRADSDTVARAAEQELLDLGFDGGPGGGDKTTRYVYAYEKTPSTEQ